MTLISGATGFAYQKILKPIFFSFDPERMHDRATSVGRWLGEHALGRTVVERLFAYADLRLEQTIHGIHFKNPIGLAAGFDKNAQLTDILPSVGFGFEEVGSVTGEAAPGNAKPRLWRLKKSKSLLVYFGLKNDGCQAIVERLKQKTFRFVLGVSIAKTNSPATVSEEAGIADYVKAYKTFVDAGIGDYYTINISCPSVFGGEPFTTPEKLDRLLAAITQIKSEKPIFIKMPAELDQKAVDEIIELVWKYGLAGFISTNLAKSRQNDAIKDDDVPSVGGMSGKVVQELSDRQIAYLYQRTKGALTIIGCGGVFFAQDAYKKIRLGASLIQMITGMVYEGPQVVGDINRGLVKLLERDGFKSISEAVGADASTP